MSSAGNLTRFGLAEESKSKSKQQAPTSDQDPPASGAVRTSRTGASAAVGVLTSPSSLRLRATEAGDTCCARVGVGRCEERASGDGPD
jgi:hypothetical protein